MVRGSVSLSTTLCLCGTTYFTYTSTQFLLLYRRPPHVLLHLINLLRNDVAQDSSFTEKHRRQSHPEYLVHREERQQPLDAFFIGRSRRWWESWYLSPSRCRFFIFTSTFVPGDRNLCAHIVSQTHDHLSAQTMEGLFFPATSHLSHRAPASSSPSIMATYFPRLPYQPWFTECCQMSNYVPLILDVSVTIFFCAATYNRSSDRARSQQ